GDDPSHEGLEPREVARHRSGGRSEATGAVDRSRSRRFGRPDRGTGEGLDVRAVCPQAVAAEGEARDAAGTGAAVVLEVGAADLDQRHGAAPEENRVAVVLEDVHPSREAFEVALKGLAVRVIRGAGGVVE